jgi:hypothetical protein
MMPYDHPPMPDGPGTDVLSDYVADLERQRDRAMLFARVTGAIAGVIAVLTILLLDTP